ncbi:hypothetical protein Nepgr_005258 [Nepenthes gracilis]|uniref:Uncharacterized protein n=1 Tax=Nepenthes gracilis TaxID=150966 RepID=A0AAD3XG41_NEPGR|nr:hypothetical protein Nepgr_005258 [Nepenthes gracilis]
MLPQMIGQLCKFGAIGSVRALWLFFHYFWVLSFHPILTLLCTSCAPAVMSLHLMQLICCYGRLLGRFFVCSLDAVVMVLHLCLLSLVPGYRTRLVADVDWPSLFEYCGDEADYWGVVDVNSLLQLRTVLASVLGWLADDLGTAFAVLELAGRFSWAEPGLDLQSYPAVAGYAAAGI